MLKIILNLVLAISLSACSKPPDLDAPCRDFGRHCSQQAINVAPLDEVKGETK